MNLLEETINNKNISITSNTMSLVDTSSKIVIAKTSLFYFSNIKLNTSIQVQQSINSTIFIRK